MEAHCITKIIIVVEQHIWQSACSFPRCQIVLLATKTDLKNLIVLLGRPRPPPAWVAPERSCWERSCASGWNHTRMVMKPKGPFIRAGLNRGSRGF
jgi:hypothetical protein